MTRFNEELAAAVTILDVDGLQIPSAGARITFDTGKPEVGPVGTTGTKDVVGGYWIFEAGSKEEALNWARRVPAERGDVIELRPIFDFPGA